jgi:TetR/AcrR family transcriptional regulator, lmrAB and yxaGH operons repressor
MAPSASSTRQRIVDVSTDLFARHGYNGTGLKAILAASEAPFGSLYHFFPGGKEELGAAAIRESGQRYKRLVEVFFDAEADVAKATGNFFEGAAAMLVATDFADACPIATVALEIASVSEPMRAAAAEAFDSWLDVLVERYRRAGIAPGNARALAIEAFCAIEGAFLLARTKRDVEPMVVAGRAVRENIERALRTRRKRAQT